MKCIVLTGGAGERLWPLSRKNCPKQFIEIENNHSIFQDTIARNIPFCDEFIIVTNINYKNIVENQLESFQGLNYRCVYEKNGCGTTAAITLACLSIEPTEYILVSNTNLLITDFGYKEAILKAKKNAKDGRISILINKENQTDKRYGYVVEIENEIIKKYIEKPSKTIKGKVYKNLGLLVFQNGVFLESLSKKILLEAKKTYKTREILSSNTFYNDVTIKAVPIEKSLLEKNCNIKGVEVEFSYRDIRNLDDLIPYNNKGMIINNGYNTQIINTINNKAVVANKTRDLMIINTQDVLYVGKNKSDIQGIINNSELRDYFDKSTIFQRHWGYYEEIENKKTLKLRKVIINPGKTIYEHIHKKRMESWTVLNGVGLFTIDGVENTLNVGDSIKAKAGTKHQISNIGEIPLELIETVLGEFNDDDMNSTTSIRINETQLGYAIDPMIKLKPALKDYLWGGSTLKNKYGIKSDLDIIAEAWVLSAHPDGESIIATGKHKGLTFSKYIETVGKNVLGWKCSPLQNFPMLVKFIDAKGDLSIQVHPNDDYALEHENQYGKNEMWYVIDSQKESGLYVGFNQDVTKEEVRRRIENNTITEILNYYPTKPGDIFFIPAGTVHAICKGNLICEIQQSSNCTYRLYDYDRRDKFGNPRELHIEKALDVLNFNKYKAMKDNISCKYFETKIIDVEEKNIRISDDRFLSIVCIEGTGKMSIGDYSMDIVSGDSFFIPAQKGILKIKGKLKLAISRI
ncbi:MAG: cupin domain-containing protein [Clostridia bacterium]|nr:cupin domain-containing protein [Bacilli bacterium]MBR3511508.1 cupin domain-containing protein [Clostridia bacterium]